jgi:hypothetical protein
VIEPHVSRHGALFAVALFVSAFLLFLVELAGIVFTLQLRFGAAAEMPRSPAVQLDCSLSSFRLTNRDLPGLPLQQRRSTVPISDRMLQLSQ